jgi:sugar phosphate isomerase/epimerase
VKALEAAQLATTIENNRILGNRLLIVAAAKEKMGSEDAVKGFAEFLTAASAACRPHGMRVGYHAHGFDFAKIGDRFAWDILFSQAGPDVVMQMDVGNCLGGGGDPVASLTAFQKRALTLHLREHQDKTFESPWYKDVFRLCETGPTQWYVVEIGGKDGLGFDTPRDALTRLRKLGK